MLEDGRLLAVNNIVWCTGFQSGLGWIKLPIFDESGRPTEYRGAAIGEPGLYFAGLTFLHSPSSTMIHGAARDAQWVVQQIAERIAVTRHRALQ